MYKKTLLILIILLVSCSNGEDPKTEPLKIERPGQFIKAVHYFSSAWPKTFWQEFELDDVEADLEQITRDGFNTIILVIPWRGFELEFNRDSTRSDPRMYARLRFLLDKITEKNLSYMVRLGFPHDFTPGTGAGIVSLCTRMYENPRQQSQWLDYLQKIKSVTDEYNSNLLGVLVSWEDFWCPHFVFPHLDETRRRELAQNIGYADWLMKKDASLLKVLLGKNEIAKPEIALPTQNDMAYLYYIEYIDQRFNELVLEPTKTVFPQAAMEIRIDKDPVSSASKEKIWVAHDLHLGEVNHRGTYWAPFWGAANNGEKLSLETTLFNFEYFLNYISDHGRSINHVIEQFNFTDNTPYFPNNAAIEESSVDDFLAAAVPLLKKYSVGYGVWAYRDYADNALFNASFEFGMDGWDSGGQVSIGGDESDHELRMGERGFISQTFPPHERFMLATAYTQLTLCLKTHEPGRVEVRAGGEMVTSANLVKGDNCFQFKAGQLTKSGEAIFKLTALSALTLDELKLYGFVQRLGLYDEFNQPGRYIQSIREMNLKLDH